MADFARIKAEIQTNPVAMAYGVWATTADSARIQALMHDPTKRPRLHVLVDSYLVVNAMDPTEFAALTAVPLQRLAAILAAGQVDMANANVRTMANAIFPVGGPTRTALAALWAAQSQNMSRAEELGIGGTIDDFEWARTH